MSMLSRVQVMKYQKDDPYFDEKWFTDDEYFTCYIIIDREQIVGMVKGGETPSVKVIQTSKKELFVKVRIIRRTERS